MKYMKKREGGRERERDANEMIDITISQHFRGYEFRFWEEKKTT